MNIFKTSLVHFFILILALALQSCANTVPFQTQESIIAEAPGDIPTWTPDPGFLQTVLATPTRISTLISSPTANTMKPELPVQVSVEAMGGNLNIRRGPSMDYNPVDVLYDGHLMNATGRDLVSRWLQIPLPSAPGQSGWVSILTEYSLTSGDIEALPVITVSPALPAYIRNCTKHRMLILPTEVELLGKYDEPYNEERFPTGEYKIYDLDAGLDDVYETVFLWEGKRVDIIFDGLGEKSKCEE